MMLATTVRSSSASAFPKQAPLRSTVVWLLAGRLRIIVLASYTKTNGPFVPTILATF